MRAVALAASILLHLSLLIPLILPSPQAPPPEQQSKGSTEITFVSLRGTGGPEDKPGDLSGGECPHQEYMGIGIVNDWSGVISAVSPGGPAWRAGIRPGHGLVSLIEHPDGFTRIVTDNGHQIRELRLKREGICYRIPTPRPPMPDGSR